MMEHPTYFSIFWKVKVRLNANVKVSKHKYFRMDNNEEGMVNFSGEPDKNV